MTDTLITLELEQVIRQFADAAYIQYLQNAPLLSHLPTIIHLNILNALAGNASVLGLSSTAGVNINRRPSAWRP